jgi:hypothetical protein
VQAAIDAEEQEQSKSSTNPHSSPSFFLDGDGDERLKWWLRV